MDCFNSFWKSGINFSAPYLACDYEHESIAFIANGASARLAHGNDDKSHKQNATPGLTAYPNPLKDVSLNYELIANQTSETRGELMIIDLLGRVIETHTWLGNQTGRIENLKVSEGIYTLVLKTPSWIISKRFVKL